MKHIKPRGQNIPRNALNSTKQEILKARWLCSSNFEPTLIKNQWEAPEMWNHQKFLRHLLRKCSVFSLLNVYQYSSSQTDPSTSRDVFRTASNTNCKNSSWLLLARSSISDVWPGYGCASDSFWKYCWSKNSIIWLVEGILVNNLGIIYNKTVFQRQVQLIQLRSLWPPNFMQKSKNSICKKIWTERHTDLFLLVFI